MESNFLNVTRFVFGMRRPSSRSAAGQHGVRPIRGWLPVRGGGLPDRHPNHPMEHPRLSCISLLPILLLRLLAGSLWRRLQPGFPEVTGWTRTP